MFVRKEDLDNLIKDYIKKNLSVRLNETMRDDLTVTILLDGEEISTDEMPMSTFCRHPYD